MARSVALLAAALLALPSPARAAGADRLYVLDCGWSRLFDASRLSPGAKPGESLDLSNSCFLVRAGGRWLLWDTGYPDALAASTGGERSADGLFERHRPKTLVAQLAEIGLKPSDVGLVAVSHTHPDHVGDVDLFPAATVLIQRPEYDWAFAQRVPPFSAGHPVRKLDGDLDVFGDGSVVLLSTPGHTPGHQSLLVRLPRTGPIVLSGDVVHTAANWEGRRVPARNVDAAQSKASMDRIAALLAERHATLWINHDKAQTDGLRHAPAFYE